MTVLLLVLVLVLLLATAVVATARMRRLHRLHQRLDAARAALDAALARRAAVALRAAVLLDGDVPGRARTGSDGETALRDEPGRATAGPAAAVFAGDVPQRVGIARDGAVTASRPSVTGAVDRRAGAADRRAGAAGPAGSVPAENRDGSSAGTGLVAAARAAGQGGAWGPAREDAENALGRALARLDRTALPPFVAAELADAERLALLGRAVHNDAVRDALALRTRRLVRWLRLSGSAPMPAYTEFVADPPAS